MSLAQAERRNRIYGRDERERARRKQDIIDNFKAISIAIGVVLALGSILAIVLIIGSYQRSQFHHFEAHCHAAGGYVLQPHDPKSRICLASKPVIIKAHA